MRRVHDSREAIPRREAIRRTGAVFELPNLATVVPTGRDILFRDSRRELSECLRVCKRLN